MHIKIESDNLSSSIGKILGIVDRKNVRPILTHVLIKAKDNQITLEATDLEVSARLFVECEVVEAGEFCIGAKNIFDVAKELPQGIVDISFNEDNSMIKVKARDVNFSLLISKTDEFPKLSFNESIERFQFGSHFIRDMISKTSHAISNDETRYNLNGIFIQKVDNELKAVATDGHVLALVSAEGGGNNEPLKNGVIIPKKGVGEIKKICDSFPNSELKLAVDDSFFYMEAEKEFFLSVRLIAREYPKYQAVIPGKTSFSVDIHRDSLLTAVKRIKLLANERSNAIRMKISAESVIIKANHPSLGDAQEKIDAQYSGDEIEFGFNAKYLLDTFSALDEGDITLEFNNEFSPVIVKGNQDSSFLGIVMPLRI